MIGISPAEITAFVVLVSLSCSPTNGSAREHGAAKAPPRVGQFQADALNSGHYSGSLPPSSRTKEILFFGSRDGYFYAVDLKSRNELWRQEGGYRDLLAPTVSQVNAGSFVGSPLIVDGVVYAGATDGRLYATEAVTGKALWAFTAKPAATGGGLAVGAQIHGTAVCEGDLLFVGSTHDLFALERESGAIVWTKGMRMWNSSPAVANGIVYAANVEGKLHALEARTGRPIWEGEGTSAPTISGGSVYVGTKGSHFYRYDAKTGKRTWKTYMGGVLGAAAVAHGLVFVGAYYQFHDSEEQRFRYQFVALGADDGETRWVVETKADFRSSPTVCGDRVFFVDNLGTVRCARARDGGLIWQTVLGDGEPSRRNPSSSPIVWKGRLYVGVDGRLQCLDADDGRRLWELATDGEVSGTPAVATSR